MKVKVEIDNCDCQRLSSHELEDYLLSKGIDTTKEISHYKCPTHNFSRIFIGESLADKVIGCVKTVIGLVPITEPWEAANAV